jgi:hypothetical protein
MEHNWEDSYHAAILETDCSKMEERLQTADAAIKARLHEFSLDHGGTPEENQAIIKAVAGLNILRKEVANWRLTARLK